MFWKVCSWNLCWLFARLHPAFVPEVDMQSVFFPPLRETQTQLNVAKIARQEIQYISQFSVTFHSARKAGRQPLATYQVLRKHPLFVL